MSPDPARLVAFLNGTAVVGPHGRSQWWLDAAVRDRLQLTADQVQALDQIYGERARHDHTQTLWRLYQTLSVAQRRQFSHLLEVRRPDGAPPAA